MLYGELVKYRGYRFARSTPVRKEIHNHFVVVVAQTEVFLQAVNLLNTLFRRLLVYALNLLLQSHGVLSTGLIHRQYEISNRSVFKFLSLVQYILWNSFVYNQLQKFIWKIIAVVVEHMVGFCCVNGSKRISEFHDLVETNGGFSHWQLLYGNSEHGFLRLRNLHSSLKEKLLVKDDHRSVPNTLNVFPHELLRQDLGHSLRQVVDVQVNLCVWIAHYKYIKARLRTCACFFSSRSTYFVSPRNYEGFLWWNLPGCSESFLLWKFPLWTFCFFLNKCKAIVLCFGPEKEALRDQRA